MKITLNNKYTKKIVINDDNERTLSHITNEVLPKIVEEFLKEEKITTCRITIDAMTKNIKHGHRKITILQ